MSTLVYEGRDRFYFGARAFLVEDFDRETASDWASSLLTKNPAYAWIVGKFVEAERPNNNKQFFSTAGLEMGQPTIKYAPMNLNHQIGQVVGTFVGAELLYPKSSETAADAFPHIESVGCLWKHYFPDAYQIVQRAHREGELFYSMEAIPRAIHSVGGQDDSIEYPYDGFPSDSYPEEINNRTVARHLVDPHFVGGALIVHPERPGWSGAEVKQVASLVKKQWDLVEAAHNHVRKEAPQMSEHKVEWVAYQMALTKLEGARMFSAETRKKMGSKGEAMPDGSYPIATVGDLKNAIHAFGRAKDPEKVKRHIMKRAHALGAMSMVPTEWTMK